MPNYNSYYNPNQQMLNQLLRQKDNVENLINQYSQPQAPVQNIINTGNGLEFEARILNDDEEVDNIFISKRTMFLDKKNKRVVIKETDGKISEEYEIIVPLDEKDKRILDLEKRLKEMEVRMNEYSESYESSNEQQKSNADANRNVKSSTKSDVKSVQKSAE